MTERDLPTVTELAGAIPDAAPSVGQEIATLRADLAASRSRQAALEETLRQCADAIQRAGESYRVPQYLYTAKNRALEALATHPAEGGQDGYRLAALERVAEAARDIDARWLARWPGTHSAMTAPLAALAALDALEGRDAR